jgi:hypothetical protein
VNRADGVPGTASDLDRFTTAEESADFFDLIAAHEIF